MKLLNRAVCNRCYTPVEFIDVSPGYWAVCPEHDEDLYSIECCVSVVEIKPLHNVPRAEDKGMGDGLPCPVCLDTMSDNISQLVPEWSDEYGEIVCTTCQEKVLPRA
jgi:hypothetical protein